MKSYPLMWGLFHKPSFQDPYISQPVFQFKVSGRFFFWWGRLLTCFFGAGDEKKSSKSSDLFAGPDQEVYEATVRASCQKSLPPYMQPLGDGDVRMGPVSALGWSRVGPQVLVGGGSMFFFFKEMPTNGSVERSQKSCILNHFPSKMEKWRAPWIAQHHWVATLLFSPNLGVDDPTWRLLAWLITSLREMFEKSMSVNDCWLILWQIILHEFIFKLLFACLPYTICPPSRHSWVDDFPFPRVGYVSSLAGNLFPPILWAELVHNTTDWRANCTRTRGRRSWCDWRPYHATVTARSTGQSFFGCKRLIYCLNMRWWWYMNTWFISICDDIWWLQLHECNEYDDNMAIYDEYDTIVVYV